MGNGITVVLNILIVVLILCSIGFSFMAFINGSLSRRSVCYALMIIGVLGYSLVGLIYTSTFDAEKLLFTASDITIPTMMYVFLLAALTLVRFSKKQFWQMALLTAIPSFTYVIAVIFYAVMGGGLSLAVGIADIVDGERVLTMNTIPMIWQYLIIIIYWVIISMVYFKALKSTRTDEEKKAIRSALIGITIALIIALVFQVLVGVVPHAHSIGHIGLFTVVFMSYKAFSRDYSIDD